MADNDGTSIPNNVTSTIPKSSTQTTVGAAPTNRIYAALKAAETDKPAEKLGLPKGANIIVQQQRRNLFFSTKTGGTLSGDATIHGLYSPNEGGDSKQEKTTVSMKLPNPFSNPEPNADERATFMRNSYSLESFLGALPNLKSFDNQRKRFLDIAQKATESLAKRAGGTVSAEELKTMQDRVNQYKCEFVEFKVIFVRVGVPAHSKGSKQRADGLWTKTTTIRNIALSRFLTDQEVQHLIPRLIASNDLPKATIANYSVNRTKDGKGFTLQAIGYDNHR